MKRFLVAASCAAFLLATIAQAGAYFTDRISIADNVITAGTLAVSAEPTSSALSVPMIAPGQTVSRSVSLHNDGTLDTDIVVSGSKKAGYTDIYESLTCRVLEGTAVCYEGPLSLLRTTPVRLPAGGSADLVFELGLPETAGDALQGDYVRLTLYVDAEQVRS